MFQRDESKERLPAFWAYWFALRALTLCANEFEIDLEERSDHVLGRVHAIPPDPAYCIAVRESLAPPVR